LENLLSIKIYHQILHPYRTAELYLSDETNLGIFGQIHPILAKRLNLSSESLFI
jgi:phenylalanyl-tRNA synthetase beta subunit